jgi:hypothetical protein
VVAWSDNDTAQAILAVQAGHERVGHGHCVQCAGRGMVADGLVVGHQRQGAEARGKVVGDRAHPRAARPRSTGADSDEERWARIGTDGCSGGAAPGSSSLAMEWTARPGSSGQTAARGGV